jgi:hypothetical protein
MVNDLNYCVANATTIFNKAHWELKTPSVRSGCARILHHVPWVGATARTVVCYKESLYQRHSLLIYWTLFCVGKIFIQLIAITERNIMHWACGSSKLCMPSPIGTSWICHQIIYRILFARPCGSTGQALLLRVSPLTGFWWSTMTTPAFEYCNNNIMKVLVFEEISRWVWNRPLLLQVRTATNKCSLLFKWELDFSSTVALRTPHIRLCIIVNNNSQT